VARAAYSSRYLTMRDGVRIAVDVLMPCGVDAGRGAPFNAVFVQSRYGRAWRLRWPYNRLWGGKPVDLVYFLFKARLTWQRSERGARALSRHTRACVGLGSRR
jgi:predicted acyl esterase